MQIPRTNRHARAQQNINVDNRFDASLRAQNGSALPIRKSNSAISNVLAICIMVGAHVVCGAKMKAHRFGIALRGGARTATSCELLEVLVQMG